ncbi:MAG: hypothetical protein QNK37_01930 [Acidobacteriota bacterium]|nr:hypothetical protein [Acidobacteriota bacterium]
MKKICIVMLFAFASIGFSTQVTITEPTVSTSTEIQITSENLDVLEAGAEVTGVYRLKNGQLLVTYDDGTYEIF